MGLAIGLLNKIILLEIHRRADQPEMEKNLMTAKRETEGGRLSGINHDRKNSNLINLFIILINTNKEKVDESG